MEIVIKTSTDHQDHETYWKLKSWETYYKQGKHHDIVYINESEIGPEIMDEVEKTKKKIDLDLPIHLSVFILNYAKL